MGEIAVSNPVRVFVLDDHEAYLAGISRLIDAEQDLEVVGRTTIRSRALDVCRMIQFAHPTVACLMVSAFANDQALVDADRAGARGFILKQIRGSELLNAIRLVARGIHLLEQREIVAALARLGQ